MRDALTLRLPNLVASLAHAPVIDRNGYAYFVHPLTDGVPRIPPELLDEVVRELAGHLPDKYDLLLTPEAMGIHLAAALCLTTGRPLGVVRKRPYGLAGEIDVAQRTGYGHARLYLNDVHRGERVVLIDDVASTGGTITAVAAAVAAAGADLAKVLVVINKDLDLAALGERIQAPVEALVNVRIEADRVVVVP